MGNLTLVIDDDVLRRARIRALEQGTSVNALVREFLTRAAGPSEAARGIARFLAAVDGAGAERGAERWTRDELHEHS